MGMTGWEVVRRVELPLAVPTIFTGLRTAAINIIATATIATLAGQTTLGDFIINRNVFGDAGVLAGAILVATLAITVELALAGRPAPADAPRARAAAGGVGGRMSRARSGYVGFRALPPRGGAHERRTRPNESQPHDCARCSRCSPRSCSPSPSPRAATTTIRATTEARRRHRDRGQPRQRGGRADDRLEELRRAVHPRRDLRPGARGRRATRSRPTSTSAPSRSR